MPRLKFRDATAKDVPVIAGLLNHLDAYDAEAGAGGFYARSGFAERGHLVYRGNPLIYYERLLG